MDKQTDDSSTNTKTKTPDRDKEAKRKALKMIQTFVLVDPGGYLQ